MTLTKLHHNEQSRSGSNAPPPSRVASAVQLAQLDLTMLNINLFASETEDSCAAISDTEHPSQPSGIDDDVLYFEKDDDGLCLKLEQLINEKELTRINEWIDEKEWTDDEDDMTCSNEEADLSSIDSMLNDDQVYNGSELKENLLDGFFVI